MWRDRNKSYGEFFEIDSLYISINSLGVTAGTSSASKSFVLFVTILLL